MYKETKMALNIIVYIGTGERKREREDGKRTVREPKGV